MTRAEKGIGGAPGVEWGWKTRPGGKRKQTLLPTANELGAMAPGLLSLSIPLSC